MLPDVLLSDEDIDVCRRFGERVVAGYASGLKCTKASMNGLEADPEAQAWARMGEVGFCRYYDLNPATALDWGDLPDGGYDVEIGNTRIDIKSFKPRYQYLTWPISKNGYYDNKQFDHLYAVEVHYRAVRMLGWVTKDEFFEKHLVAPERHPLMAGTWYMPLKDLHRERLDEYHTKELGRVPTLQGPTPHMDQVAQGAA